MQRFDCLIRRDERGEKRAIKLVFFKFFFLGGRGNVEFLNSETVKEAKSAHSRKVIGLYVFWGRETLRGARRLPPSRSGRKKKIKKNK